MKSQAIPCLKYTDAKAAIAWLEKAFGFHAHLVVPGERDIIAHAQLTFQNTMIMISSSGNSDLDKYMKSPGGLRGINTQIAYIIIDHVDDHYTKAKEAGAKIILDIKDEEYGGRGYTCQDPQGVIWSFGTYDPWADQA